MAGSPDRLVNAFRRSVHNVTYATCVVINCPQSCNFQSSSWPTAPHIVVILFCIQQLYEMNSRKVAPKSNAIFKKKRCPGNLRNLKISLGLSWGDYKERENRLTTEQLVPPSWKEGVSCEGKVPFGRWHPVELIWASKSRSCIYRLCILYLVNVHWHGKSSFCHLTPQ